MERQNRIHQGYADLVGRVILNACDPRKDLVPPVNLTRKKKIAELNKWKDKELLRRKVANQRFARKSPLISHYADCVGLNESKIRTIIINSNT